MYMRLFSLFAFLSHCTKIMAFISLKPSLSTRGSNFNFQFLTNSYANSTLLFNSRQPAEQKYRFDNNVKKCLIEIVDSTKKLSDGEKKQIGAYLKSRKSADLVYLINYMKSSEFQKSIKSGAINYDKLLRLMQKAFDSDAGKNAFKQLLIFLKQKANLFALNFVETKSDDTIELSPIDKFIVQDYRNADAKLKEIKAEYSNFNRLLFCGLAVYGYNSPNIRSQVFEFSRTLFPDFTDMLFREFSRTTLPGMIKTIFFSKDGLKNPRSVAVFYDFLRLMASESAYFLSSATASSVMVWMNGFASGENSRSSFYKKKLKDYNQKLDFAKRKESHKLYEKLKNGSNGAIKKLFNAIFESESFKNLVEKDGGKLFSNKIFEKVLQEQCLNSEVLDRVMEVLQEDSFGLGFAPPAIMGGELVGNSQVVLN